MHVASFPCVPVDFLGQFPNEALQVHLGAEFGSPGAYAAGPRGVDIHRARAICLHTRARPFVLHSSGVCAFSHFPSKMESFSFRPLRI